MQFARNRRQRIDNICRDLRDSLNEDDDRGIDQAYADLQDALSDLNREVRQYYAEDEDDDLFGTIRDIFIGDRERDEDFYDRSYGRDYDRGYGRNYDRSYSRDYDRGYPQDYDRGGYGIDSDRSYGRDSDRSYSRDSNRSYSRDSNRSYGRDSDKKLSRDNSYPIGGKGNSRKPSKPSYQDNWDDEDDDWL